MKIGILTFHWGTNYGGVLQAYALQTTLEKMGYNVVIVNYSPITYNNSLLRCFKTKSIKQLKKRICDYQKERKFISFRNKYLKLTNKFLNIKQLEKGCDEIDVFICGSDQIWNPYIALNYGYPYFLSFVNDCKKKISYAVSLGCVDFPNEVMNIIKPLLLKFDHISVRENSAVNVLKNAEIESVYLMPDPALLIDVIDLENIISNSDLSTNDYVYFYVLQENQKLIQSVKEDIAKNQLIVEAKNGKQAFSIEDWILAIRNSKFIVTNSFHGIVFSLLFHKEFIAVPIEGIHQEMNDRILTLLKQFGLEKRILTDFDKSIVDELLIEKIDWFKIDIIRNELKYNAIDYLKRSIEL